MIQAKQISKRVMVPAGTLCPLRNVSGWKWRMNLNRRPFAASSAERTHPDLIFGKGILKHLRGLCALISCANKAMHGSIHSLRIMGSGLIRSSSLKFTSIPRIVMGANSPHISGLIFILKPSRFSTNAAIASAVSHSGVAILECGTMSFGNCQSGDGRVLKARPAAAEIPRAARKSRLFMQRILSCA